MMHSNWEAKSDTLGAPDRRRDDESEMVSVHHVPGLRGAGIDGLGHAFV